MSDKPAIVLVTGSFALPDLYTNILEPLRAKGYEIASPALRSVGKKPGPPPTLYDDAKVIASEAARFADEGKDVVLIAHSYGGAVASQAVEGLSKAEREKQGKKGGIVRIGYITSLVPEEGEAAPTANVSGNGESFIVVDEEGWMHQPAPEKTAKLVFNNLSPELGIKWAARFTSHSAPSFASPLTYAGYKDVPTSWLLCENDLCIKPEWQRKAIERIERVSGRKVDVTSGGWDHVPSVEKPEDVIGWIEGVVGKGGEEN